MNAPERDGRRQSTPCKERRVREGWWSLSRRTASKGRQAPVNVQIGTAGAGQRRVKDGGRVITATVKDGGRPLTNGVGHVRHDDVHRHHGSVYIFAW